jgi:hypothetical protein
MRRRITAVKKTVVGTRLHLCPYHKPTVRIDLHQLSVTPIMAKVQTGAHGRFLTAIETAVKTTVKTTVETTVKTAVNARETGVLTAVILRCKNYITFFFHAFTK